VGGEKIMHIKKRLFIILEPPREGDLLSRAFDIFILALIGLNVLGIMVESVTSTPDSILKILKHLEFISVIIFVLG
jgi:voltage-gated potassium channel